MNIIPNLHFHGDCEKAMELYEKAFKARRTVFLRYKDADPHDFGEDLTDEKQNYVYHAEMMIGDQRMMMNDHTEDIARGVNVSLLVSFGSKEEVIGAYEILKDGARIIHPVQETTYSGCFVSLIDRYGVRWELMNER